MDVRPFLPVCGSTLCEFKGGPLDKLGLHFDDFPKEIVLDGHRYVLRIVEFPAWLNEDGSVPEDVDVVDWDYVYEYQGKVERPWVC